jgi:CRISPR/Cas system-associated exonuclease Cas4 (RecB family)
VPYGRATQITSWSYSRYSLYTQCPLKAKLSIIDKLKEPPSPAMERGTAIHKEAEDYMKGSIARLPASLKSLAPEFKAIRAARKKNPALVPIEETWAMRRDWSITTWNDWNECWLRVKLDAAVRTGSDVVVNDVKTGKFRADNIGDYEVQLQLYGLGALIMFGGIPDVRVTARLLYVDAGTVHPEPEKAAVYVAKDLLALKKDWERRVKPMLSDKTFAPKPNRYCYSCSFRKDAGGPCAY